MALLEVKGLKTYFFTRRGLVKAVDGVDLALREGETLGLVGESGSGKTVTGLSILRLVPQPAGRIVSGRVLFNGEDLLKKSEREMNGFRGKHISMISQDPLTSLNPVFTVGFQVAEGIAIHQRLKGRPLREKAVEMFRFVRIPESDRRFSDFPHQFSGGMRQRIVGAMALACRPHLLIADEPTTSLDVITQAQYLNLLREIQREQGLAIIFITHDLGIIAKMCRQVAVMYAGKIVEKTGIRELFNRPMHPYTQALMASLPKIEKRVARLFSIPGQPPALDRLPNGCAFNPRCPETNNRCECEYPPEVTIDADHVVRCWKYA